MTNWSAGPARNTTGFDGWAVIDIEARSLVRANPQACELLGITAAQLPAELSRFLTTTDFALLANQILPVLRSGRQWQGGLRLGDQLRNGHRVELTPSTIIATPHLFPDTNTAPDFASLLFASTIDFVGAVQVPDPLTGLPTRSALFSELGSALRRNRAGGQLLAAFFLDLDGLKKINDRYGHEVGDTALIETAQRIAASMPPDALAVRFGGDEFVILHENVTDIDAAVTLANDILTTLSEPGDYHAISCSIGVAFSRNGEVEPHELIRRADSAMYRAKARGGSRVAIFDAEMRTRQLDDEELRSSLLQAISSNGFGVAAQPIYELATGRIHGVELFIRVRDDAPYIADANQLFRLAHEYGEALDAAVLGRALALARLWRDAFGTEAPRLQVNVSTQSIASSQFARRVGETIAASGLRPGAIAFEIDCQDLATAGDRERTTIEALQSAGVPIVVDGFGDSSLTLQDLADWCPVMVKLDGTKYSAKVLGALVRAVSTLRIPTAVKGASNPSDLDLAVRLGAYACQGNALTPVRTIDRINALLHGPQRLGF